MDSDVSEAVAELRELRRGRGLLADDVHRRVGPRLRIFCGIDASDPPAAIRRKLVLALTEQCRRLPSDLRLAVQVALALHETADHKFLHERLEWLASQFDRDPRTARRRIDEGLRILAESVVDPRDAAPAATPTPFAADGWFVASMRATLRFDVDPPRLIEERLVVATADDLDEVVSSLSIPRRPGPPAPSPSGLMATMLYGGEIVETRRPSRGHARFVVRLPRPLNLGEQHEFSIEYVAYPRAQLPPYYAVVPLRRYDHVQTRVRFGTDRLPAKIWRLSGVHPRVVDEFTPGPERVAIDSIGEVRVEFFNLRQGLSYGLQWEPSSEPP
ncbi:hypothetical protein I6A84_36435 [Frankia sp. CNm7]|uniref:Uncharacterized protein n=1 Tax=Frankia nepalensis TaxID=1836974 RepID=A0A937REG5_9ACTN|nr:hypothetical protein [Frankia nepalensis]MBL7496077.1 hypothetical protein [Frankia nepalensis]MBL7511134.1 hypothetical protein [Frankia nepalensis]MBL7523400.1 hypothetical protein [Frankia nepalensis]MBL7630681.1 hypothetical protein [Frankia nepalensis]